MRDALEDLNINAQWLAFHLPRHVATPDSVEARQRFQLNLDHQLANCTLPGERQTLQINQLWHQYQLNLDRLETADADRPLLYRQVLLPQYVSLNSVAQGVANMNMSNMIAVDGRVKGTLIAVRNAMLLLLLAGVVLAMGLVGTVGATLIRPLRLLTQSARQIESGDLNLDGITVRSRDEVGQLAEAFNAMAAKLREFRQMDHERLLRTQQTTQLAIDSLPDAVIVISPTGQVELSNRTAQTHFGIVPGRRLSDLHLLWLGELHNKVVTDAQPLEPQGYRSAIQLFDEGHERFLLPRAVPMFSAVHKLIGVTVILVDLTVFDGPTKSRATWFPRFTRCTPLTRLDGHGAGRQRKTRDAQRPPAAGDCAARDDAERLYRTVENLLGIARIESGRSLQLQPLSVRNCWSSRSGQSARPLPNAASISPASCRRRACK